MTLYTATCISYNEASQLGNISQENYLQASSVGCSEDWDLLFSWRLFQNYFKITAAKIEICLLHSVHFHEKKTLQI